LNIIPTQKIVKGLICDEKGNEIVLPKAKKNEYSFIMQKWKTLSIQ
jgi:hypothetical protein